MSASNNKEYKAPRAITVAMVKDPVGTRWQAQVQIEYKMKRGTDVLTFIEDTPMHCLTRAREAIEKRCFGGSGVRIIE